MSETEEFLTAIVPTIVCEQIANAVPDLTFQAGSALK